MATATKDTPTTPQAPQTPKTPQTGKTSPSKREKAPPMPTGESREHAPTAMRDRYTSAVRDELQKQFGYSNVMQIPRVGKIIVNIGMGESIGNGKAMDAAAADLAAVTGQRPIVTKSRKAISNFRLREGMPIGLKVTLRGERMWHFLEKLITVALPRIRDFQGVPDRSFDGRGNYTLGLVEQLVFPEIEYDKIDRLRGLEITIVTTAKTDEEGRALLRHLGMPFRTASSQS